MSTLDAETPLVRPEIAEIFADLFLYEGPMTPTTSPDDIQRWDSLQHIALIRMLEQTFGVSLTMDEMVEIRSVGDIETVLQRHGA